MENQPNPEPSVPTREGIGTAPTGVPLREVIRIPPIELRFPTQEEIGMPSTGARVPTQEGIRIPPMVARSTGQHRRGWSPYIISLLTTIAARDTPSNRTRPVPGAPQDQVQPIPEQTSIQLIPDEQWQRIRVVPRTARDRLLLARAMQGNQRQPVSGTQRNLPVDRLGVETTEPPQPSFVQGPVTNPVSVQPTVAVTNTNTQRNLSAPATITPCPEATGEDQSPVVDEPAEYKCSICLDSTDYTKMKHLPCCHAFHQICIDAWLMKSRRCPLCRLATRFIPEPPPPPAPVQPNDCIAHLFIRLPMSQIANVFNSR